MEMRRELKGSVRAGNLKIKHRICGNLGVEFYARV